MVEKFIGDAVMAVFGLHQAHEDDPHRAIRAALGMRAALDELNAELGPRPRRHASRCGSGSTPATSWSARSTTGPGRTSSWWARPSTGRPASRRRPRRAGSSSRATPTATSAGRSASTEVEPLAAQGDRRAGRGLPGAGRAPGRLPPRRGPGRRGRRDPDDRPRDPLQQLQNQFWDVDEERRLAGGHRRRRRRRRQDPAPVRVRPVAGRDRPAACGGSGAGRRRSAQNVPNGLLRDVVAARLEIQERDPAAVVREKLEAGFGPVLGTGRDEPRTRRISSATGSGST